MLLTDTQLSMVVSEGTPTCSDHGACRSIMYPKGEIGDETARIVKRQKCTTNNDCLESLCPPDCIDLKCVQGRCLCQCGGNLFSLP